MGNGEKGDNNKRKPTTNAKPKPKKIAEDAKSS